MKKFLIALTALLLAGCASKFDLPPVEGARFTYVRSDPLGGTTIEATGVKITETDISAEHASWSTKYPQFSVQLSVDGYHQVREVKK